ncbi:hypothetical protein [Labedella endophytica]|uniref:hypothetical protein n=1 Tax=Labedella endophytica TaxID=1523160 RepID=UPI001FB6F56A|nr:hypothetical protein [Labedella endophytica]
MTAKRNGPDPSAEEREVRAAQLKERVYVTFTSLAVVLALRAHASETTAGQAATTLVIAVVGTLLAVFVADFVSHIAVHEAMPNRAQLRHMIGVTWSALGVLILPLIFLALAGLGAWTVDGALLAASIALVASLVAVGFLAVRRVRLPIG